MGRRQKVEAGQPKPIGGTPTAARAVRSCVMVGIVALALSLSVPARASQPSPEPSDMCPAAGAPPQIEVLPFQHIGNTCSFNNSVASYTGACTIQSVSYKNADAIYKVRLHKDNVVGFGLDVIPPADLVLALVRDCANTETCVANSPDFIGSGDEVISPRAYAPGDYFLYVDAADDQLGGKCGSYVLTVTGVNPTPDLVAGLVAPPTAVAGTELEYSLAVANVGALEATGVRLTLTLPGGVAVLDAGPACARAGGTVVCTWESLVNDATPNQVKVKVLVKPDTRGSIQARVEATANEGEPTPSDNEAIAATTISSRAALSIAKSHSGESVVAGTSLTYILRVANAGPSDATQVVVTDHLPDAVTFVSGPSACKLQEGTVTCSVARIAAGANVAGGIKVEVSPGAGDLLANTASVEAAEPDPDPSDNTATRSTEVVREADLSITKTVPEENTLNVAAGGMLRYTITVGNMGPSDSTGLVVVDVLPSGVELEQPIDAGKFSCNVQGSGGTVRCTLPRLARKKTEKLILNTRVESSLLSSTLLVNRVSVIGNDPEPGDAQQPNSALTKTIVAVRADLEMRKTATRLPLSAALRERDLPDGVYAGENLLYTMEIANCGPSDSRGGAICVALDPNLEFLASPDGCRLAQQGKCSPDNGFSMFCPVPPLVASEEGCAAGEGAALCADGTLSAESCHLARYVVAVKAQTAAGTTLQSDASVTGRDKDPDLDNNSARISTTVARAADLKLALSDAPDPVEEGGELTYRLEVTNAGPSDTDDVEVELVDPPMAAGSLLDCLPLHLQTAGCPLAPGDTCPLVITCIAPDPAPVPPVVSATFKVLSKNHDEDPDPDNNTAVATTTVATNVQADVAVMRTTAAETAVAGDLLPYTLTVVNNGPAVATGVTLEDPLPAKVSLEPEGDCTGVENNDGTTLVQCALGDLAAGEELRLGLTLRVAPDFPAAPVLFSKASVSAVEEDPNPENNDTSANTPVLAVAPLVLPAFEIDEEAATTLLAVRNRTQQSADVRFTYTFFEDDSPDPIIRTLRLAGKELYTENLRDLPVNVSSPATGLVEIEPVEVEGNDGQDDPRRALSGDVLRLKSPGVAGGELLSTDASRVPPELCQRWAVRFLNGGAIAGDTDFLFFVPNNSVSEVAVGEVYTEKGRLLQRVTVVTDEERPTTSFARSASELFGDGLPLLATAGTIEWTFLDDAMGQAMVGHVEAVLEAEGQYSVAIPGVCLERPANRDLGSEDPLVLPYFEVDTADPVSRTTLFSVRNGGDEAVVATYRYFLSTSSESNPVLEEGVPIPPHGISTVDLRNLKLGNETKVYSGWVEVALDMVAGSSRRQQILSGDFALVDLERRLAAGGSLVDKNPERRPPGLCQHWEVWILELSDPEVTTDLLLFFDPAITDLPTAHAQIFAKDGSEVGALDLSLSAERTYKVSVADLFSQLFLPPIEGSIEIQFGGDLLGSVAAVFSAASKALLIPGVCGDDR